MISIGLRMGTSVPRMNTGSPPYVAQAKIRSEIDEFSLSTLRRRPFVAGDRRGSKSTRVRGSAAEDDTRSSSNPGVACKFDRATAIVYRSAMHTRAAGTTLLAGWLLMSPPLIKDAKAPGGYRLDSNAKVADWNQLSAHDSATDCERAKSQRALDAISMSQRLTGKKGTSDDALVTEAMHTLCVPSDYIYGAPPEEDESTAAPSQL
jgi:hypothetical protein